MPTSTIPISLAGTASPVSVAQALNLGLTTQISMNDAGPRKLCNVSGSGTTISMSNLQNTDLHLINIVGVATSYGSLPVTHCGIITAASSYYVNSAYLGTPPQGVLTSITSGAAAGSVQLTWGSTNYYGTGPSAVHVNGTSLPGWTFTPINGGVGASEYILGWPAGTFQMVNGNTYTWEVFI